ncbi:MAG: peptidoglycan-binding protein [Lysobacterales bacterium]|jgi:hypothetical protein
MAVAASAAFGVCCATAAAAPPQEAYYESEPNNTPAEANAISGAVEIYGAMPGSDQDGFIWTVSDNDARKRWTFELAGIPGALTIAEVVRVQYAENGEDAEGIERLMKMGTRDGLTHAIANDLMFEPGDYLIGIAHAGSGRSEGRAAPFRPPVGELSFGDSGSPDLADPSIASPEDEEGAYRFTISEGSRLLVSKNPGPRKSRDSAQKMKSNREFATFETEEVAWYELTFDERDLDWRWDLNAQVPVGRLLDATLYDDAGGKLAEAHAGKRGKLSFPDLSPQAKSYFLELRSEPAGLVHAVATVGVGQRAEGEEAEPNDKWNLANRVDLTKPIRGRVGKDGEYDYFRFDVSEPLDDQFLSLRLESAEAGPSLDLCLLNGVGERLQCRRGEGALELPGLKLAPGPWGLMVSRGKKGAVYTLSLTAQGEIGAGVEAEPNDRFEDASGVPANNRIKGRISGDDTDFYAFLVTEKPQLWRFQVIGKNLSEVAYHDVSGKAVATVRPRRGENRARLDNLFLLPGKHYLKVRGTGQTDYTLLARPLGPPDPDGEREPNNDESTMQRLAMGQSRTGLLAEPDDRDYYRFFLGNWDHIRLTIRPPPDGTVKPYLYWYGSTLGQGQPRGAGEPLSIEGLFPPGDYRVRLDPEQTSDAEYRVSLERLPRFSCPSDCEPSGMGGYFGVSPLPPSLHLEGRTDDWRDFDAWALPRREEPYELIVRATQPPRTLSVGKNRFDAEILRPDGATGAYRATVPAGAEYQLIAQATPGGYSMQLEFPSGPAAVPTDASLPVELGLSFDADAVSAYRSLGQRVTGTLDVRNTGQAPLDLEVEAATSDYRWRLAVGTKHLAVAPGQEKSAGLSLAVPPDAWAKRPVRISAAVRDNRGVVAETWRDITVDTDAEIVNPEFGWSVPDSILGGLNAAWTSLGGEWFGERPASNNLDLIRDGLVFEGIRTECCGSAYGWKDGERPALTLKLPGDTPVPVAGMALNFFGTPEQQTSVRKGALLLSEDGENFEEILNFETQPIKTDQYFTLNSSVPARYARVRFDETYSDRSGTNGVKLGEWKVILEPGFDLSEGRGFNLADPGLGGHLVSDSPPGFYSPVQVLETEREPGRSGLKKGQTLDYVVGFNHNRVAQIERVEWLNVKNVNPDWTLAKVSVAVSTGSPVGPWQTIGELTPGVSQEPAVLNLDRPVWARFVKYSGVPRGDGGVVAAPGQLRIWERPTDSQYRTVLGEWGYAEGRGPYELANGLPPEPELRAADNDARERAAVLQPGVMAEGEVQLAAVEHWYRLTVPAGNNTLRISLAGTPTVRTRLELQDEAGNELPVHKIERESVPGLHLYEAVAEAGSTVWLRVFEPPRNVVFSWDTSASVIPYLPTIYNSLAAFAGQVVPGQEAVNLAPFGRPLLLRDWHGEPYVLQTILNDYPRRESSSAAEQTIANSARALAPLPGTKAIVVITDGITNHHGPMWKDMAEVQPRVFGVHVGGSEAWNIDVFEDWASVNGGHYRQLVYDGEMEVAFDRAAAMMRRPADYSLSVETSYREAPGPGRLFVVANEGSAVGGAAVELILDASGSMLKRMEGKRRIAVAKEVLTEAVRERIPPGTPVALRVFGHKEPDACRTDLEIPLAPLDPEAAARTLAGINAMNLARTPIADSLAAVAGDLEGTGGKGAIVLVTDGEETCDGDPAAVIESLQKKGLEVNLNIVGFAIGDADLEQTFENWAELGGGRYFSARNQEGLSEALNEALRVPFAVYDTGGNPVANGVLGGAPLELEQGIYRVEIATSPSISLERVEVPGERAVTVTVSGPGKAIAEPGEPKVPSSGSGSPQSASQAARKPRTAASSVAPRKSKPAPSAGNDLVRMVQRYLSQLGYDPGPADGKPGMRTMIAISEFQAEKGMKVTGEVTPQLAGILAAEADARK